MTTQAAIDRFLSHPTLAVAGASRGGKKFGNTAVRELAAKGYDVALIHPEAKEIDGRPCYASVADLPDPSVGLVLIVPPDQTERIVREAADAGIRDIWMQQGSESPNAVQLCRDHGIDVIHGECILMFAKPAGIHKFHHWLWGLFGKLPKGAA